MFMESVIYLAVHGKLRVSSELEDLILLHKEAKVAEKALAQ